MSALASRSGSVPQEEERNIKGHRCHCQTEKFVAEILKESHQLKFPRVRKTVISIT